MILVVSSIKLDGFDAGSGCFSGNRSADFGGRVAVTAVADVATNIFVASARAGQRFTVQIVDDLAGKMLQGTLHAKSRMFRSATRPVANMVTAALSLLSNFLVLIHLNTDRRKRGNCFLIRCWPAFRCWPLFRWLRLFLGAAVSVGCAELFGCALTRFDFDWFALIANPFAFVGLGLPQGTDFGGELSDFLLVAALDDDVRLIGTGDREFRRNLLLQFVCVTDPQLQGVALDRGEVADAD